MLKKEELAFVKALSNVEVSPLFLKEVKKAVAAGKKKTTLAAHKAKTSAGECPSWVGGARTYRDPLLLSAPKRKATSNSHGLTSCLQQPGSPRVGATYAAVLSASVAPSQPSGTLKPTAMGSDSSESGFSMETSERRLSEDISGPLSGTPDGTTNNIHVANTCILAGQRPNKKPIFISGVSETRAFLAWLRASSPGGLVAQRNVKRLIVVPSTAEGFRAAVTALRSLDGKEGVSFHTFTLPSTAVCDLW